MVLIDTVCKKIHYVHNLEMLKLKHFYLLNIEKSAFVHFAEYLLVQGKEIIFINIE